MDLREYMVVKDLEEKLSKMEHSHRVAENHEQVVGIMMEIEALVDDKSTTLQRLIIHALEVHLFHGDDHRQEDGQKGEDMHKRFCEGTEDGLAIDTRSMEVL